MTIVELLSQAYGQIDACQAVSENGEAKREYALAKTAIEDAIMRTNRAFSKERGIFGVADVERGL